MNKRVALYARVSGDDRKYATSGINGQLEMCREYAQEQGWQIITELAEDERGAGGAKFDLPQLSKALEMAQAGELDVLVTRELDRFARGLAKQLIVEEQFKRAGVDVVYVLEEYEDTPEGNLTKNIRAVIAEYERLKITERLTRGTYQKVKSGSVMTYGNPPYGYNEIERNGRFELEINEAESRVVLLIFDLYANGDDGRRQSLRGIARKLNEMGIKKRSRGRGQGKWTGSTVRHILINETYIGTWRFGKDKEITVDVPAIITMDLWERVQARLDENRTKYRGRKKHDYLMVGHLACSVCGNNMSGNPNRPKRGKKTYLFYRCFARSRHKSNCSLTVNFRADHVDAIIWVWIRTLLRDPEKLRKGLYQYQQQREEEIAPTRKRVRVINDLLAGKQEKLTKALDLYLDGDFPRGLLLEKTQRLKDEIKALTQEQERLGALIQSETLTRDQIKTIQEFAERVGEGIETADNDFKTRREVIDMLNVQATLGLEDDKKVMQAWCILGEKDFGDIEQYDYCWRHPSTAVPIIVAPVPCLRRRPG